MCSKNPPRPAAAPASAPASASAAGGGGGGGGVGGVDAGGGAQRCSAAADRVKRAGFVYERLVCPCLPHWLLKAFHAERESTPPG